jgi:hypothetical protein
LATQLQQQLVVVVVVVALQGLLQHKELHMCYNKQQQWVWEQCLGLLGRGLGGC